MLSTLLLALAVLPQEGPRPLPGQVTEDLDPAVLRALEGADPTIEGWGSEILLPRVGEALRNLEDALEGLEPDPEALATPALFPTRFVPAALKTRSLAGPWELASLDPSPEAGAQEQAGHTTLRAALDELAERLGAGRKRIAWKTLSAEGSGEHIRAEVLGSLSTPDVEIHASWTLRWRPAVDGAFRLSDVQIGSYSEVRRTPGPGTGSGGDAGSIFSDATADLLRAEPAFGAQLALGIDHWRRALDASLGVSTLGHQGLAVADIDGDRVEELYLLQPGGLPNLLLVRGPDGRATDRAAEAGLDFLDPSRSALFFDIDGDGDQDLALAFFAQVLVLENDGKGSFSVRTTLAAPTATSLAAADYDLDGNLDLYVCSYVPPYDDEVAPLPYHDANNGEANHLYRNEGSWEFTDVTAAVGLDAGNQRFTFAAAWEDLDADGDPDLYVANDFGRNNYYRNDGGHFVDIAAEAGVEDLSAGMGVTFADYDRDGAFDLHVSNMFSSAGNRVTYGRRFQEEAADSTRSAFRRHARGNSLFKNAGEEGFLDVSAAAGINVGRWAWGALFTDFDNDGFEDLYVPNGFVTGTSRDDDL